MLSCPTRRCFIPSKIVKNMSTKCQVAVCQFTATNDKQRNLSVITRLVGQAATQNAKIIFLPEATDYIGTSKEETKNFAEPLTGDLVNEYKKLARKNDVWLSIGGFHERVNDLTYNSHLLIDNKGAIKSVYRKIHLFDVCIPEKNINLKESDFNQGGSHILPPVETPAGNVGLAICYDLRFPELGIIQRKLGAQILTYPSAFTSTTGQAHWEVLLRSRAIENQCFVIAAAQYGRHNEKRVSHGQSIIIDPWGKILAQCAAYKEGKEETNESIAVATLDLEQVEKVRKEMPVFEHRRNDIYTLDLNGQNPVTINDNDVYKFADKIIPGSTVFYKTLFSFAFTNIRCVVPGHVLVASIRPTPRLEDLTEEEISDLFKTAVKVEKAMEKHHSSVSTTVCVQDGKFAGQTVPHVHVHILPRKPGDFERNDDVYDSLARHDREDNPGPIRSREEMSEEAKVLRQYFNQS